MLIGVVGFVWFVGKRRGMRRRIAGSRWIDLVKKCEAASVLLVVVFLDRNWTIRVCLCVF